MSLPPHVLENLIRSGGLLYPRGSTHKGHLDLLCSVTRAVSNSFRKCDIPIRLGLDTDFRCPTGLTVCNRSGFYTVPMMLLGGVVTLGKDRISVDHAGAVAQLVRAIIKAIERGATQ